MQQPSPSTSTLTGSGQTFEDNLATLSEMFPACDIATLRNYMDSFCDNPNCMTIIVGILLEGDCTSGANFQQNSKQLQCGLKRKAAAATVEDILPNEDQIETPSYKVKRGSICRNEAESSSAAVVLREAEELNSKANILGSATRETSSPLRSHFKKEEPCSINLNRSETGSLRSPEHFGSETSSNVDDEEDIVFVKSVANSPKQSFHRTKQSSAGTTSPKPHNGICIRYKGGNLHPSMNKPKKLQIVKINAESENTTNGKGNDYSLLQPCKSTGSVSKEKATENPSVENTQECPLSTECEQMKEVTQSNNASSEGTLPVTAALSDLEILKKVFPDADPTYISSLLEKYADEPNRVALVGKELGSNPVPSGNNTKKKAIPPVPWFWESESGKLVPFTDSECNALEKEFNTCDTQDQSSNACVKAVRLPGSTKHFTVNFGQMIMVCESGKKTPIIRVPGGSNERKEIG